jgi:hypothetical protein
MFYMMHNSNAPYLRANLTIPVDAIYEEAKYLLENNMYMAHREDDAEGWNVFTLYGESAYITIGGNYGNEENYHWPDIAVQSCPKTIAWLQQLPYKKIYRARFMFLQPGGYIKIHHDKEPDEPKGFVNTVYDAMNIAINNPENCYVKQIYEDCCNTVPFKKGTAFFFNNRYYHYVENNSDEVRVHMIIHADWHPVTIQYEKVELENVHYTKHEEKFYSSNQWNNLEVINENIKAYSPNLSHYS